MSIEEGEKMIEATNKYNRIVKCGTQNRSGDFAFSARDYIKSGKLGKIFDVKAYCIFQEAKPLLMKEDSPVPQGLNCPKPKLIHLRKTAKPEHDETIFNTRFTFYTGSREHHFRRA